MPFEVSSTPPPPQQDLRIGGLSLLFFDYYRLADGSSVDLAKAHVITTQDDYLAMFDIDPDGIQRHQIYHCNDLIAIPPVQLAEAGIVGGTARLLFRIVDRSFLIAITVVTVHEGPSASLVDPPMPAIKPKRPFVTSDILTLIREVNDTSGGAYMALSSDRHRILAGIFGRGNVAPEGEKRSRRNIGIQIWSIANRLSDIVDGIHLTTAFAWELSALLECTSEQMLRNPGDWRKRRKVHVEALMQQAAESPGVSSLRRSSSVLTHGSVCIEISQLPVSSALTRSIRRLAAYGFDSTSLYLWSIAAAEEAVLIAFTSELSDTVHRLHELIDNDASDSGAVRRELKGLLRTRASLYRSLNTFFALTSRLREQRHVVFFREAEVDWSLDGMRREVDSRLVGLTQLASAFLRLIE